MFEMLVSLIKLSPSRPSGDSNGKSEKTYILLLKPLPNNTLLAREESEKRTQHCDVEEKEEEEEEEAE